MDLYNIPGDKGGSWRAKKFLEYKNKVPYVDVTTLLEYSRYYRLDKRQMYLLIWLHSVTYSEATAICLFDLVDWFNITPKQIDKLWIWYKPYLQFSSSRVYVKSNDWFPSLMKSFTSQDIIKLFESGLTDNALSNRDLLYKRLSSIKYNGRFSVDLILLMLTEFTEYGLLDIHIQHDNPSWKNGSNMTSGMLNILYMDEEANKFDKTGILDPDVLLRIEQGWEKVERLANKLYPGNDNTFEKLSPRICPYRNLFKCTRYAGFHHDRQLEQIRAYHNIEQLKYGVESLYDLRQRIYPRNMLGEHSGWSGIRKDRKKLFLTRGELGIETIG